MAILGSFGSTYANISMVSTPIESCEQPSFEGVSFTKLTLSQTLAFPNGKAKCNSYEITRAFNCDNKFKSTQQLILVVQK